MSSLSTSMNPTKNPKKGRRRNIQGVRLILMGFEASDPHLNEFIATGKFCQLDLKRIKVMNSFNSFKQY